ncbi:MAG: fused MFS/spermidine synthase [Planctomycetota bacterium]|nr:MAG: fused MFS/spermidine synthase [Planctomycetota bacterium]
MSKSRSFFLILIPSATVFTSSFCIMVLELVAGRLIARHLGSSLYTWTSVIGIVLAGIMIGNYLGGRIADRFNARKTLAVLFGICSLTCVVVVVLNNLVGEWLLLWKLSWPLRVLSHVCLVFLLPSILLGTISPVVTKMALDRGLPTGRTVGDIYAWGAAGSIAGTFVAGFYLIAAMGTIAIIWTIGGALLLMAILYWTRFWVLYIWAAIFLALITMGTAPFEWAKSVGSSIGLRKQSDKSVLYEDESQYCYIAVRQLSANPDIREFMQDKLRHSEIAMADIDELRYFYTKIYAGITHGLSKEKDRLSVMVIGGGGYVYPRYIEKHWPDSRIDVAEIDPGVTEAAMRAFGLKRNTSINTISMDARNYVDELLEQERTGGEKTRYDFIYEDAINDYSVPFQLVTDEFNEKISTILADDGVYLVNLIDIYESGQFLGAVINTIKDTLAYVYVLTEDKIARSTRNTFVVIGSKHELNLRSIFASYGKNLGLWYLTESDIEYLNKQSRGIVLTDDYAPVENLLAPVVRQSAKEILARRYLKQAEKLKRDKKWHHSILKYEKALQLDPSMSIKAYNEIGIIHVAQGNLEKAVQAFQNAIDYQQQVGSEENIIASIHFNLGVLLGEMDRTQQSIQHLHKASELFRGELAENPDDVILWTRLGNALASAGDFKEATEAFRKALALNPNNMPSYDNLVKALEYQGRYDEAIEVLQKQIQLMKQHGDNSGATGLQKYIELLQYKKSKQEK